MKWYYITILGYLVFDFINISILLCFKNEEENVNVKMFLVFYFILQVLLLLLLILFFNFYLTKRFEYFLPTSNHFEQRVLYTASWLDQLNQ